MSTTSPFNWVGTAFSCPHMFGWLPAQDGSHLANGPFTNAGWMDWAVQNGLSGVEIPLPPNHADADAMQNLADHAAERNLKVILGAGPLSVDEITDCIRLSRRFQPEGPIVMRATLSKILCGDRRMQEDGWQNHMQQCLATARELVPILRDNNASVALENHQDATSTELMWICQLSDARVFGVTLDTGNPLSVGEDFLAFTRNVAPFVRHVHCKDYTLHFARGGYRLVRCAAGKGVVPFAQILSILQQNCRNPFTPGVENAAQPARLVPFLDPGWWTTYPLIVATDVLPVLQILWDKGLPESAEWRTPWEQGATSEAIVKHETGEFNESCRYLTSITANDLAATSVQDESSVTTTLSPPVQILNM